MLGRCNRDLRHRFRVRSISVVEPERDREAAIAFLHRAHMAPPKRFDRLEHVRDRCAVASDGRAIDLDLEHRLARDLFDGHVCGARDRAHDAFDLAPLGLEDREIITEEPDTEIPANARDHLGDSHLDRLHEIRPHTRHDLELLGHLPHELVLGRGSPPRDAP